MHYPINEFTDDELFQLVKDVPIQVLIRPLRDNPGIYHKYTPMLGRGYKFDEKQKAYFMAQAIRLFKKRDQMYVSLFEDIVEKELADFLLYLSEIEKHEVTVEEVQHYSTEKIVEILKKYMNDSPDNEIDIDFFCYQAKLCGLEIDDETKKEISRRLVEDGDIDEPTLSNNRNETKTEDIQEVTITKNELDDGLHEIKYEKKKKTKTSEKKTHIKKQQSVSKDSNKKGNNDETEDKKEVQLTSSEKPSVIVKEENNQFKKEDSKMKTYAGRITIISSFYNIMPFAYKAEDTFVPLNDKELDELLPNSAKRNVNLAYNIHDDSHCTLMQQKFYDGEVVLFEFETEDLQDNLTVNNERNQTGYKVPAIEYVRDGKIRFLSDDGFYRMLDANDPDEVVGDIEKQDFVELESEGIALGEKVFVRLKNGFCAGPYEVQYSSMQGVFNIKPKLKENKYILYGYNYDDLNREYIEQRVGGYGEQVLVFYPDSDAEKKAYDVLSDKDLLDSIKTFQQNRKTSEEEDTSQLLQNYQKFFLTGKGIPKEVQDKRINRAQQILSSEDLSNEFLDDVSDILFGIIINNQNDKRSEALIDKTLERHPDLVENIQSMRVVQNRINSVKGELENYNNELEQLKENKKGSAEVVDKNSIQISQDEYEKLNRDAKIGQDYLREVNQKQKLKEEVEYLEQHKTHLQSDTLGMETKFSELVNGYSSRMVEIAFDGFMSSKLLDAASGWKKVQDDKAIEEVVEAINQVETSKFDKQQLIDYLVSIVKKARPLYSKNTIINLFICTTQGFLTVFAGTPGCGKTSICNILGKVLGLTSFKNLVPQNECVENPNRFVSVSVERGWTSKRDFIGYYNPLTKTFEESNREVFTGLRILDKEYKKEYDKFPYMILLDEANLSQMEYYWADFMNVCDDRKENHTINMGNSNVFNIPDTLHFLATINNDNTIETLSPRLIDRAWIITLPKNNGTYGKDVADELVTRISWPLLRQVFDTNVDYGSCFDPEIKHIYEEIKKLYANEMASISSRSDKAIKHYYYVASRLMEEEENISAGIIAFDYAVAQKLLPTIIGNGESYREFLNSLKTLFDSNNMLKSSRTLAEIISRGDNSMKYYQFF